MEQARRLGCGCVSFLGPPSYMMSVVVFSRRSVSCRFDYQSGRKNLEGWKENYFSAPRGFLRDTETVLCGSADSPCLSTCLGSLKGTRFLHFGEHRAFHVCCVARNPTIFRTVPLTDRLADSWVRGAETSLCRSVSSCSARDVFTHRSDFAQSETCSVAMGASLAGAQHSRKWL